MKRSVVLHKALMGEILSGLIDYSNDFLYETCREMFR